MMFRSHFLVLFATVSIVLSGCGGSSSNSNSETEPDQNDSSQGEFNQDSSEQDNSEQDNSEQSNSEQSNSEQNSAGQDNEAQTSVNQNSSYFPISSDVAGLTSLKWEYALTNNVITTTTNEDVLTLELSTVAVEMALTLPTERIATFSGPVTIESDGVLSFGNFSSITSQDLTRINDQTFSRSFNTNVLVSLFADDDFGQFDTEIDLNLVYSEPAEVFLGQTDLNNRVGETFSQQLSGTLSGFISAGEEGFSTEVTALDSPVSAVSESYLVKEALSTLTVRGRNYTDVVVVDYLYDQLNPQTGNLEPTTTTYYLARGIGIIKALNLTQVYGTPLNWELISTNLIQQKSH